MLYLSTIYRKKMSELAITITDRPYHVRCHTKALVRDKMEKEQARRRLEKGEKVSLMTIAAEWLEEMAVHKPG